MTKAIVAVLGVKAKPFRSSVNRKAITGAFAALLILAIVANYAAAEQGSIGPTSPAQQSEAGPVVDVGPAPAGPFGFAVKRPVVAAACPSCPWGVVADKLKEAMSFYGWDLQICSSCARDVNMATVLGHAKPPPRLVQLQVDVGMTPPPDAPVDLGVGGNPAAAYNGVGAYQGKPRKDIRIIGRLTGMSYLLVAVRKESLIGDLSDIKTKHLPAIILLGNGTQGRKILDYYGINEADLVSWGGKIESSDIHNPNRGDYSVLIGSLDRLNNSPETGVWYLLSQTTNMLFLHLPDDLLQSLKTDDSIIRDAPANLVRGMDPAHGIRTILSFSGSIIYGLDTMPDQFTYDAARALDEHQDLLRFASMSLYFDKNKVWDGGGVPLATGAARYYREKGYLK